MTRTRNLPILVTGALVGLLACAAGAQEARPGATRQSPEGRLHGTVVTRGGTSYTGLLRWEDEEAFWGDLFNSSKDELEHTEHVPDSERRRGREIKVFGFTVGYHWDESDISRQFIARFGDIERLDVVGRERVKVRMKSGTTYEVEGGSNDIGADIVIQDARLGTIEVDWRNIERVEFQPTPADLRPTEWRLYGKVATEAGAFEGFVQWDSEECLSSDELDGETADGDLSIPMGNIRAIEKRNRDGAWVELVDGRRLLLEDTNDVDHSIRGIFVEDERFGRVKIGWDSFERVDFRRVANSGRPYSAYRPSGPLSGTVTTREGRKVEGRIVYDLDEAEGWEMLNGKTFDVELYIPFERIQSVVPKGSRSSLVVLRGGRELHLEEETDVGEDHAGVLVYTGPETQPTYVAWRDVARVDFD